MKKRVISYISILLSLTLLIGGCSKEAKSPNETELEKIPISLTEAPPLATIIPPTITDNPPVGQEVQKEGIINVSFDKSFNTAYQEYTPLEFSAKIPEYSVAADLSNVENLEQYGNLTEKQKDKLAENGFVVIPSSNEQLFYIYEENSYKKIPSFITVDSVLQVYHIFYDYSLRNLETDYFIDDLKKLNANMLETLIAYYNDEKNNTVKDEILKTVGYIGVSALCLGLTLPDEFPQGIYDSVLAEVELIKRAEGGLVESPLLSVNIDYSLFTVRGHYTRSDELGDYFRAMSWYGVVPMPFYDEAGNKDVSATIRAIIITAALCKLNWEDGGKLWNDIYNTTSFYVGEADDISPADLADIIQNVYLDDFNISKIPDKLDMFYEELKKLPKPMINSKMKGVETGLQFRFMGQRYIPDSEILQELCDSESRPFPTGLDVFAVFGSERAEQLLDEIYKPNELWEEYQKNYDILSSKFRNLSVKDWTKNLYYTWLYTLNSITGTYGKGYPMFMQNIAWQDKSLSTALGSWAELRHDTILYGKQSSAEGGGNEAPQLTGYVEPNPETYNRLLWLTRSTRANLEAKNYLSEEMSYKLDTFENMLEFLRDCALKELRGEDLDENENYRLLTYGRTLEYISSSIAEAGNWYLVESETDKNMAVIADVHTVQSNYLEVGVGYASEIYVIIPQKGKLYLTRGAVFDYFEFVSDKRLTDEEWQDMIKTSSPERPTYTDTYIDEEQTDGIPTPETPYYN